MEEKDISSMSSFFSMLPHIADQADYELGWFRLGFELLPAGLVGVFFGAILASANLPHGADEIRELLAGSILWVTGGTVAATAAVYAAVGLFHYVFREQPRPHAL